MMRAAIVALLLCCAATAAHAHDPSRSLLTLAVDGDTVRGRLDVSLRDLEDAVGLDANGDAAISWGELESRRAAIEDYARARLTIGADGVECPSQVEQSAVDSHGGNAYAVLDVAARCASTPRSLRVGYALLFDVDPAHRSLIEVQAAGRTTTAVLSRDEPARDFELARLSPWSSVTRFVVEGVHHILSGYDHLAFVALLLLPIALGRRARGQAELRAAAATGRPETLRAAAGEVMRVITAFTAAHSTTLALAALGVVTLPSRWVESAIALSVLVAAVLNLAPRAPRLGAKLAFGFGLVHGLGFASALGDLGARESGLIASLLGFNLGVELGQLAVVAVALPLLFSLRGARTWSSAVNYACSSACGVLGAVWLAQRLL